VVPVGEVAAGARRETTVALLMCDLVDSTRIVQQLGDAKAAAMFERHDAAARELLARGCGREIDRTDGFLLLFPAAAAAVGFALAYHEMLEELSSEVRTRIRARVGIHFGRVILRENPPEAVRLGAKPLEVEGLAKPLTARLMALAAPGQTLLSREAADAARAAVEVGGPGRVVAWAACGAYRLKGIGEPVEVFAVGTPGSEVLAPPAASEKARPLGAGDAILGWRPAAGVAVPGRPGWTVERRIGEGASGEVWLAHGPDGGERVLKFCFDAGRLRTLRREVTLLRLLREALGRRGDIARVLGWRLDDPPFYLEMEYAPGGDLVRWLERRGAATVPLEVRVAIAASVAEALAAAHSVGVVHKDVKPSNVLVAAEDGGGAPRVLLTDFGIGALADTGALERLGLTATELAEGRGASSGTLAYMAPELFDGEPPSPRTDIYALGVLTYQLVIGNFRRPLAPGWERHVPDELLREDIAAMVAGDPAARVENADEVARRLRTLEDRREARRREREAAEAARRAREELARARRRRRILAGVAGVLALFAVSVGWQAWRAERARRRAELAAAEAREVSAFLEELFEVADPTGRQGATVTARELLDRGARRVRTQLAGQPRTRARLEVTLGRVYLRLGLLRRAEPLLEGAEAALRAEAGETAPEHLAALRGLAELRVRQRRFPEALELLERAEAGAAAPADRRAALEGLERLYRAWGRMEEAHRVRRRLERQGGGRGRRAGGEEAVPERYRPQDRRPLRLVASLPFPGRVTTATVLDWERGLLLAASPDAAARLDESGLSPPMALALENGDRPVAALPDGRLAVATRHGLVLRGYDPVSDARQERETGIPVPEDAGVVVAPDGATVAVVRGREVTVFAATGAGFRRTASLRLPFRPAAGGVAVGRGLLATVDPLPGHERLLVLELPSGRVVLDRRGDWVGRAQAVAVEPLGGWVAVGGWFDEVLVYRVGGGEPERVALPGATYGLAFFADHPSLVIAKVGRVALWRRGAGLASVHEDPQGRFYLAGRSPSAVLVADERSSRLLRFAYRTVRVRRLVGAASHALWATAHDPASGWVFAGSEDGTVARYDLTRDTLRAWRAHGQGVTALLARGGRLVSASDDRTVAVWGQRSLRLERRAEAHGFLVNALDLDPAGILWTSSSDRSVRAWRYPELAPLEEVRLGFSAAGLWIRSRRGIGVVGGWDGTWSVLERRDGGWRVRARHRWEPEGLYRLVELGDTGLLLGVGVYPSRVLLVDPGRDEIAPVPCGRSSFLWADAVPGGAVLFGDGVVGLLEVVRSAPRRVRVRLRVAALAGVGMLSSGVAVPERALAVGGSGSGQLVLVSLHALEAVPPALDRELELGPAS